MIKEYAIIKSPFTGGKVFRIYDVEEKIFRAVRPPHHFHPAQV